MNFVKEQIDELNAVVKVKVAEVDYAANVDKVMKDYQKKASLPGFRPGKVPVGMIKKMYGKSILADEINKLLYDKLNSYISESKIEILGNPLPRREETDIDWDNQKEFEFSYDLGLSPVFNVELNSKLSFDYLTVKIDDQLINKYVDDIARRYGKISSPETAEDKDVLFGEFTELTAQGEPAEGGFQKNTSVALESLKNDKLKKQFVGLTKGSHVTIKNSELSNAEEAAGLLGTQVDEVGKIKGDLRFTVSNISRMDGAELNEELFRKVYGEEVKTLDDFRNKIKEELSAMFNADSDRRLKSDVMKYFVEKLKLSLPDEFLKRWLLAVNEKPLTVEQVNAEYSQYAESLKHQLIENKLIRGNNITVTPDELREHVRDLIKKQFSKFNQDEMDETELNKTVNRVLSNEEESRKLFERLYDEKVLTLLKTTVTLKNKELSYEEFYKVK